MSVIEGVKQPWVMIQVINVSEDNTDTVINIINDTIQKVVSEGIDRELLEASLAACEFAMREKRFRLQHQGAGIYTFSYRKYLLWRKSGAQSSYRQAF